MNKKIYDDIKNIQDAIENNTLVVFVGAGVSANSGVPTWGKLVSNIAQELGLDKNINSNDYLKIAQYYKNKNKEKFLSKIKQKLSKNWEPNEISKYLFKNYNARYFITTNYDDILEQTAKEQSKPYKTISKDEDIPKIGNNSAIIKMHGDFDSEIILAENDYLQYSEKFRLTETFIKSLFATNTILFVGFSADDPNVNQIYFWVNNILKEKGRKACLLQIDEPKNGYKLEKKYFNKKGIKIINYHELKKEINSFKNLQEIKDITQKMSNSKGKQLFKLLYLIKNFTPDTLEKYYLRLKPSKHLNFISCDDLDMLLNENFWGCFRGQLESDDYKNFNKFIDRLEVNEKYSKEIKNLLAKAGVKKLNSYKIIKMDRAVDKNLTLKPAKKNNYKALSLINSLDLVGAKKYLEKLKEKFINDDDYINKRIKTVNVFEKPYLLYELKEFEKAYNLLKKISYKAKEKNLNLIFVISEFNRRVAGWNYYSKCRYKTRRKNKEEYFKELQQELEAIKIDKLMDIFLSSNEKKILQDKLNFEYIQRLDHKILKDKNKDYDITAQELVKLHKIYAQNYIFIENRIELREFYKDVASGVFSSIQKERNDNKICFNIIELILIIKTLCPDDLNNLIYKYEIKKIPLNQKDESSIKKDLLKAYYNWINSIINFDLCKDLFYGKSNFNYLYNFFLVFSLIDLTKKETSGIIIAYINLLKSCNFYDFLDHRNDELDCLMRFIYKKFNDKKAKTTLDFNILITLIEYVFDCIDKIKKEDFKKYPFSSNRIFWIIGNLSYYLSDIKPNFCNLSVNLKNDASLELLKNVYIPIHKIVNKETKEKIKKAAENFLKKSFDLELYHYACLRDIIEPNLNYEEKIIPEIENKIKEYIKLKIEKPTTRNLSTNNHPGLDNIYEKLVYVANLLNNEKILKPEMFEKYKNHKDFKAYDYFNFTHDMNVYNYKNFDLSYLKYITDKRLKILKDIISNDENKKSALKQKLYETIKIETDNNNICKERLLHLLYE